jgi:ribA/ribD-fused uncharacterized protein
MKVKFRSSQEGRGIGIGNKMKAYYYQQMALYNTVQANRALGLPDDARSYVAVRDILAYFQIASIRLLTNNPRKVHELTKLGVAVAERVPHVVDQAQSPLCAKYLHDKAVSMGHAIPSSAYQDLFTQSRLSATVRFYEPDAPNGFLSNFYPSPIVIGTHSYPTVEHFYQSEKFSLASPVRLRVASAPTPRACFDLAHEHSNAVRKDWPIVQQRVMWRGIIHKFKQHAQVYNSCFMTNNYDNNCCNTDAFFLSAAQPVTGDGRRMHSRGKSR